MYERARPGIHFADIRSTLSKNEQADIIRVLNHARALDLLSKHPLATIRLVPQVRTRAGAPVLGKYLWDPREPEFQSIHVATERPSASFRQPLAPGRSFSISSAGVTERDAIRRTLVHELAHHLRFTAGPDLYARVVSAVERTGLPVTTRAKPCSWAA